MLPDPSSLTLFLTAALVILVIPGPAVLYITARSIEQGPLAGIVSTLGVGFGTLFHVAAATLGVSALLVSSALAFTVLKYLGAAYLIYLGVTRLLAHDALHTPQQLAASSLARLFTEGVIVNVLNPKTALFFFAFLPQFIDPGKGPAATQMLALGGLFVVIGIVSDGIWALVAGGLGRWLKDNPRYLRVQRHLSGWTLIGLGVYTAVAGNGRK